MIAWFRGVFGIAVLSFGAATVVGTIGHAGMAVLLAPPQAGWSVHAAAWRVIVWLWFVTTIFLAPLVIPATLVVGLRMRGSLSAGGAAALAFALAAVGPAAIAAYQVWSGRGWGAIVASTWFVPALVGFASGAAAAVLVGRVLIGWVRR